MTDKETQEAETAIEAEYRAAQDDFEIANIKLQLATGRLTKASLAMCKMLDEKWGRK